MRPDRSARLGLRGPRRLLGALGPVGMLGVAACLGCAQAPFGPPSDPFLTTATDRAPVVRGASPVDGEAAPMESAGTARVGRTLAGNPQVRAVRPAAGFAVPTPSVAGTARAGSPGRGAIVRTSALQDLPPGWAPPTAVESSPELYPDEYLFDGGDRALPVHYGQFVRNGLDTEDTVAEFSDHRGNPHTLPSTRVAVYAPRFGSVTVIGEPVEGIQVELPFGAYDRVPGVALKRSLPPAHFAKHDPTTAVVVRSRPGSVGQGTVSSHVRGEVRPGIQEKLQNLHEEKSFLMAGRFVKGEMPYLARSLRAALVWTRDVSPVSAVALVAGQEIQALARGEQLLASDDTHLTDGQLRIVKLADKESALPGEIVTFTIRYDNLGDRELRELRIVDNLTPRLEYVTDSADSDRAGRLVVEDNEEGSLVLTFEVTEPIKGHTGGVVLFQARVR